MTRPERTGTYRCLAVRFSSDDGLTFGGSRWIRVSHHIFLAVSHRPRVRIGWYFTDRRISVVVASTCGTSTLIGFFLLACASGVGKYSPHLVHCVGFVWDILRNYTGLLDYLW